MGPLSNVGCANNHIKVMYVEVKGVSLSERACGEHSVCSMQTQREPFFYYSCCILAFLSFRCGFYNIFLLFSHLAPGCVGKWWRSWSWSWSWWRWRWCWCWWIQASHRTSKSHRPRCSNCAVSSTCSEMWTHYWQR